MFHFTTLVPSGGGTYVGSCFTHTNITSFTFYDEFIIKSKRYKKVDVDVLNPPRFTVEII